MFGSPTNRHEEIKYTTTVRILDGAGKLRSQMYLKALKAIIQLIDTFSLRKHLIEVVSDSRFQYIYPSLL
ncbi:MAG: hypothetical protein QW756_06055 [Nitrososphaerota archaeon]